MTKYFIEFFPINTEKLDWKVDSVLLAQVKNSKDKILNKVH